MPLPNAPLGLTVQSKTDTSVSIKWDAVTYPGGIKEYEVYKDGKSIGKRVGTSYTDSGLTAETTYKYKVRAVTNTGLTSDFSNELTVITESTTPPEEGS
ncbi:fibronectin type III domain-containing protein [Bacillus sp. FJAT-49705]|uniref:Fibronectin type III domain-containing protein n=1 Tax=Cytobacillus citreus TaxID=2833586 RepID=A0ABS5NLF5_9BACI|nr:fibronectin type III domain-containing protein [Cytobacillus citreus]MBS4188647.1 fibronectin type III domain-containing protein [Cytobacillus citreus]